MIVRAMGVVAVLVSSSSGLMASDTITMKIVNKTNYELKYASKQQGDVSNVKYPTTIAEGGHGNVTFTVSGDGQAEVDIHYKASGSSAPSGEFTAQWIYSQPKSPTCKAYAPQGYKTKTSSCGGGGGDFTFSPR